MIFAKQIEKIYRAQIFARCDNRRTVRYFSAEDFEGLECVPFPFVSSRGLKLQGYFYSYEGFDHSRLIIFDHGYGGGHRAYMTEIETLCRHGFRVFAYDHTGCMESEGESTLGLAQSLCDLNDALNALKAAEAYRSLKFSVIGHSWGAFSTLNIAAFHPDVAHIVAISGFVSVEKMVEQNFSGLLKPFRAHILELERKTNPKFAEICATDTLKSTNAQILLIYSSNDKMVKKEIHFDALKNALGGRENVRFILADDKGHNPNYTTDAVRYLGEFSADLAARVRKKKLVTDEQRSAFVASYDWRRMTMQDESIWQEIFNTLDKE